MSATILSSSRWRAAHHERSQMFDIGFAALRQFGLDSFQFRCGPPETEWSPRHWDADDDPRLMVALSYAAFH
jgi:hypothetical protein